MNWRTIKQLLRSPDLRKRLLAVLAAIVIFRILSHVPVPVGNTATLTEFLRNLFDTNRLFSFVDLFSGGAVSRFSIVLVGLSPYITASIIMQLGAHVLPALKELQKEGEQGRHRINQYTRLITLPLAIGQSIGTVFLIRRLSVQTTQIDVIGQPSLAQWVLIIAVLTAGAMLLMWLGELISEKGIGNGISLLIAAGIIARFPSLTGQFIELIRSDPSKTVTLIVFVVAALVAVYLIVKLNEAQRTIKVSYAKRIQGARAYGGVESILPIRILTAGVIPIIFAVAFLSIPTFLGQLLTNAKTAWLVSVARDLNIWFQPNHIVYTVIYFLLVVAFTYFYTGVVFNTRDIAENLQKQGGFIPGIRPGNQTASYLRQIVSRLTLFGAISLGVIAILPFIGERMTGSSFLTFGGTGLLIVISVAIETLRQVESQAITSAYQE
ncbi:preprotein translocase subunit SecY [Candidatus Microgenomates bacterium]|nr:preprotein translocase subunit SecY [Candidatus Microgenomates bacterium]